jgi:putative transposase
MSNGFLTRDDLLPGRKYDFTKEGCTCEIIKITANNVFLEDIDGGAPKVLSLTGFWAAIESNEVEMHQLITSRTILSANRKATMEMRLIYVKTHERLINEAKIEGCGITNASLKILKEELEQTQPEHALNMPSLATLSRWKGMWLANRCDTDLAPKYDGRSGRKDPRAVEHAKAFIFNHYLTASTKPSIRPLYDIYCMEAKALVAQEKSDEIIEVRHFYRLKDEMNQAELEYAYSDYSHRAKMTRTLAKQIHMNYALERVEIDRVHFNFGVLNDDDDSYAGAVSMYIAIDCCTRVILGITVEVGNAESSLGAVNLFKEMLTPYSDTQPYCGIPYKVVLDNGPGMANQWIETLIGRLRIIDPYWAPPGQPWKKPFIESFNDLIVDEFFKKVKIVDKKGNYCIGLPGFLGSKKSNEDENRRQVKVQDAACMYYSDFLLVLHKWLLQYHTIDKHPQLGMTPHERWQQSCLVKPLLPCHYNQHVSSFHLFKQKAKHKLQARGWVQVQGQKFSSKEAKELYLACCVGVKFGESIAVEVEYFAEDARYVTISVIKPGDPHTTTLVVPNRNIDRMSHPIPFSELNGEPVSRRGICEYEMDALPKRKQKRAKSRTIVGQSHEDNLENELTGDDVIAASHATFSKAKQAQRAKTKTEIKPTKVNTKPIQQDDEENDLLC